MYLLILKQLANEALFAIITGVYTGMIMARYTRFAELRSEALRIVRAVNYIEESSGMRIWNDDDLSKISLIAGDLLFLHHTKAGHELLGVRKEVDELRGLRSSGRLDRDTAETFINSWQFKIRKLEPSIPALIGFSSRL